MSNAYDISLPNPDMGDFSGFLALPATPGRQGAILVIQEIFGLNADIRQKCLAWAAMGYVALAPDLFWRQEPGIQLTDQSKEEWDQALALLKGFDVDKGVQDLQAAMNYLRAQPYCTGQVGAVGYCLGGKLAYLMSTRTDINLAVSYYGVGLGALMPEAVRIQSPLLMHIAEQDKFVSPDEQHLIKTSLQGHPHAQIYSYLGVDHAFTRLNGEHYDAAAAQQANDRTTAFITKYLPLV